jgi:hypothetical protein
MARIPKRNCIRGNGGRDGVLGSLLLDRAANLLRIARRGLGSPGNSESGWAWWLPVDWAGR